MDTEFEALLREIWEQERPNPYEAVVRERGQGFLETMLSENHERQNFNLWPELELKA